MTKEQLQELIVINQALGGKYDDIVTQIYVGLGFGEEDDLFGGAKKRVAFQKFVGAIKAFYEALRKQKIKCNNNWIHSKFIQLNLESNVAKVIKEKGAEPISTFFNNATFMGNHVFDEYYFLYLRKDYLLKANQHYSFQNLWDEWFQLAEDVFGSSVELWDFIDKNPWEKIKKKFRTTDNQTNSLINFFIKKYVLYNGTSIDVPKVEKLYEIVKSLYTKCYTLTKADYQLGIDAFETHLNDTIADLGTSKYKDCTVLPLELKSGIIKAFNSLQIKSSEATFSLKLKEALIKCIARENLSLVDAANIFKKIKWPAYNGIQPDSISNPSCVQDLFAQLDLKAIFERALDTTEACFVEQEDDFLAFVEEVESAVEHGFLEPLNKSLVDFSVTNIPNIPEVKRVIAIWLSSLSKYSTYALFLRKAEDALLNQPYEREHKENIKKLGERIYDVIATISYDSKDLAVALWNEGAKTYKNNYMLIGNKFFPDPTSLIKNLSKSTVGVSVAELNTYVEGWRDESLNYIAHGVSAIYRYSFKTTLFKVADFIEYLQNNSFNKDTFQIGASVHQLIVDAYQPEKEDDKDINEKIVTQQLIDTWKDGVYQKFDVNAFTQQILDKFHQTNNEKILLDIRFISSRVLPNLSDIEFALLYALTRRATGKARKASNDIEIYKNHRKIAETYLESIEGAINALYDVIHQVRQSYAVALKNYTDLYKACKETVDNDNALKEKFAKILFKTLIDLAFAAMQLNKNLLATPVGKEIIAMKDSAIDAIVNKVVTKDTLYYKDAQFLLGMDIYNDLDRAIDSMKKIVVGYMHKRGMNIRNTLMVDRKLNMETSDSELDGAEQEHSTFEKAISDGLDDIMRFLGEVRLEGLSEKFERAMVAHWLHESGALTSNNGESFYDNWNFTLPRTKKFREKMAEFGVVSEDVFDDVTGFNIVSGSLLWAIGINEDAQKKMFKKWDRALIAVEDWADQNADGKTISY